MDDEGEGSLGGSCSFIETQERKEKEQAGGVETILEREQEG